MRAGFQRLYPVNPKNETVQGLKAYAEIEAVPELVDLVIVALSADATLPMLERCHALGIKAAMVYASGYAETNETEGAAKQEALVAFRQPHRHARSPGPTAWATPISPMAFSPLSASRSSRANLPATPRCLRKAATCAPPCSAWRGAPA